MRRGWVPTAEARQIQADMEQRRLSLLGSPMVLVWDRVFGGHLARDLSEPVVPKEARMDPIEQLRAAMLQHAQDGEPLMQAVRRWTPNKANPERALDGSDLDAHPPEHRARKLREAQAALRAHR